jgi:AraC family transcriptional regulator, regulatory protein of adaptative response / methylated-DNA-[protein]-cysteine methyltransferase
LIGHNEKDKTMTAVSHQPEVERLRFAASDCWLGIVLVATSADGVAAILIGEDAAKLRRELTVAFPHADLVDDALGLRDELTRVVDFLVAPSRGLDLPLDIRGDALQQAVWKALRAIPPGQTVAYGKIAKTLPIPATAQDVGAACAANVLAVAIPCHRVVKADGSISGYRWGVQRKKLLINREAMA